MSSPQRGRKRGPYKPRQPKTLGEAAVAAIATGEPQIVDPPQFVGEPLITYARTPERIAPERIRWVLFRYAWNDGDTCPALMWDGNLAVLMPPYASPAAGCSFTFRASTGGFSFAPAIPGAGVGQYTEV